MDRSKIIYYTYIICRIESQLARRREERRTTRATERREKKITISRLVLAAAAAAVDPVFDWFVCVDNFIFSVYIRL